MKDRLLLRKLSKTKSQGRWLSHLLSALFLLCFYGSAHAQDHSAPDGAKIGLELNKLSTLDSACELTFLVKNQMTTRVEKLALEFAFLDNNGQLSKLVSLNFGALVPGRPKITQFGLPGIGCENISQVFINSATECVGIPGEDCIGMIARFNKTSVEF